MIKMSLVAIIIPTNFSIHLHIDNILTIHVILPGIHITLFPLLELFPFIFEFYLRNFESLPV